MLVLTSGILLRRFRNRRQGVEARETTTIPRDDARNRRIEGQGNRRIEGQGSRRIDWRRIRNRNGPFKCELVEE